MAAVPGAVLILVMAVTGGLVAAGGLMAARRPDNPVGWLFLGTSLLGSSRSTTRGPGGERTGEGDPVTT